ncbi:MAG: beta strand repeat-containing protein, partial [Schwartzia sp. (in: firmicutes)]
MFTKGKKRQYLALSVALALGGAWCGGASYQSVAEAADLTITGASPVIPAANEAKDESGIVIGAAAGVENDSTKTTAISGKTTEVSGAGTAYAGNVYAGYSIGSGNVTGNTLDFKDGTLTKNAYAGYSVGSVTGNTATMTGGTVNKLYGGYSVSGAASTNNVLVTGGSVGGKTVGGYSETGSVSGNRVYVGQAEVTQSGKVIVPATDTLTDNVTFTGDVIGGQVKEGKGSATTNEVFLNSDPMKTARVNGNVYGALTADGDATGNKVKLEHVAGLGTGKEVYGAKSSGTGNLKDNTVDILGYTTVDKVVGGESAGGNVEKNKVTVTTSSSTVKNVIGGTTKEKGNAVGNEVDVTAATGLVSVVGGQTEDGKAEGNKVKVAVDATGDIVGGQSRTGDVVGGLTKDTDYNVELTSEAGAASVYGGRSNEGNVTGNKVKLETTGTVATGVYGGMTAGSGTAEGNKVKIGGAAVIGELHPTGHPNHPYEPTSGRVIGGQSEGGDVRNNEVTIENDGEVGQFVYGGLTTGDGKAEGNTVKITKGTVIGTAEQGTGGSVWGGRSVDGAVKNNTVEISGRRLTADPPDKPPVTPPGTPYGTYIDYYVYGGHATGDGAVENNTVTVTGGTVHSLIYGGQSNNGVVKNNTVKISGTAAETSVQDVYGGQARGNGAAEGNKVEIDSAGVKTTDGKVVGGYTANGDAKGNTVTFTKNAAGSEVMSVYGGYVDRGASPDKGHGSATDNTVILHAGTIDGSHGRNIYGGFAERDSATGNKVILEKDVVVNGAQVYGGQSCENGDASRNEVTLRGDNVKAKFFAVYGGQTSTGRAEGNKVAFHGGKVTDFLVGGEGDSGASSNEVTIENGDFSATTNWIIGGKSGRGSTDKNTVTIHKVVHDTLAVAVTGGKGGASASHNTVTLGKMTTSARAKVTGGSAGEATHPGEANGNTVNLTNVEAGAAVTGGDAIGGSANENKVNMTGGKVTAGDLIGGKTTADATGKAGDANENVLTLTKVRELQEVTGGASAKGTASKNIVTIDGTDEDPVRTEIKGAVFGGYTAGGAANHNEVTLRNVKDAQDVTGGVAGKGSAEGNKVTVDGGSFHHIIGGESVTGGSADKNEVKLTNLKAISGELVGGVTIDTGSTSGNTVEVSSEDGKLAVTGAIMGGRAAEGSAEKNAVKLTNLKSGGAVKGGHATKGTVEKADATGNTVEIAGGAFRAVTGGTTDTGDASENTVTLKGAAAAAVMGGDVTVGGSAKENTVTVDGGKVASVTGGSARAADGDAAKNTVTLTNQVDVTGSVLGGEAPAGKAEENKVEITGGKIGNSVVAGLTADGDATGNEVTLRQVEVNGVPAPGNPAGVAGGAASVSGNANSNKVTIEGNETGTKRIVKGDVAGGSTANGDASSNVVSLKDIEVQHAVYGGQGTGKTSDNIVRLNGVTVGGTVYGGTGAAESLNNTLEIYGKASTIGDFSGVQNLHFYVDSDRVNDQTALLTLTSSGAKDIKGLGLGVKFSGDAKILHTGDQMTLLKASGALTTDDTIENKFTGSHGSSLHYEFDIAKAATDDKTLVATVTAAGMKEETKSYVETRAALADMVNHAGDVIAGESLSSAKKAAAAASA